MIHTTIPYCPLTEGSVPEPGKDLGYAINQTFERLHDDDWLFNLDHDVVLTTRHWYRSLERAVERYPDAGFFTVMRAPAICEWAVPVEFTEGRNNFDEVYWQRKGIRMDRRNFKLDVRFYRDIGERVAKNYVGQIADITDPDKLKGGVPNGGLFLISKRVWKQLGGFKPGFKDEQIDFDMHYRVRDAGLRAFLIQDVFLHHQKDL